MILVPARGSGSMTKMAGLLIAMMLTAVPMAAAAQDKSRDSAASATIGQAFSAIQAGDPARALSTVEPVLASFEKDFSGEKRHIFCSETAEQEGYYLTTADGGADNVRLVTATWCEAQYVKAFALVDLQRLDDAKLVFERLVGYAPKHARYLNELGYVFLKKKEWQHSIDIYTSAEAAASFTPERRDYERCVAFRGIGYDLVELGRLDDAEAVYRKCLAIIPDEPKSLGEIEYIKDQRKKTT
jgi:Tfp pilus assembly protein PilF